MLRLMKSFLIVSVVATTFAAVPSIGTAQDLELRVGPGGARVYDRDRYNDRRGRGGCDPYDALDKARDRGYRRPQVVSAYRLTVVVEGMTRRGPARAEFSNRRGCPLIRSYYLR